MPNKMISDTHAVCNQFFPEAVEVNPEADIDILII